MSDVTPVPIVPLMHVALYQPDIPFNTGNIARTCLALRCRLHLIGKLGFSLEDRYLKRAGWITLSTLTCIDMKRLKRVSRRWATFRFISSRLMPSKVILTPRLNLDAFWSSAVKPVACRSISYRR